MEILQSVNNRTQSLWEIAYYAWLLLTYIVFSTLLGRVTRHPAGMHCPAGDDAFVSSFIVVTAYYADFLIIYLLKHISTDCFGKQCVSII